MLTSCADDEALIASIMAGAAGYVLKQVGGLDVRVRGRRRALGELPAAAAHRGERTVFRRAHRHRHRRRGARRRRREGGCTSTSAAPLTRPAPARRCSPLSDAGSETESAARRIPLVALAAPRQVARPSSRSSMRHRGGRRQGRRSQGEGFSGGRLRRQTTPELENGDRGGWPPFSKHRCLGRGRCPSHSGDGPPVGVEPKVMDWRPQRATSTEGRGHGAMAQWSPCRPSPPWKKQRR